MSAVSTNKRGLNDGSGNVGGASAASKKKVGRKLLDDSDAKSKRTFQNRNAQRAFRERKERKLKDLESKVMALEQMNQAKELETNFLTDRLKSMADELKKYRPANKSDLEVLEYLAKREQKAKSVKVVNPIEEETEEKQETYNTVGTGNNVPEEDQEEIISNIEKKKNFTFEYPTESKIPSPDSSSSTSLYTGTPGKYNVQIQHTSGNNQVTTPDSSVSSATWIHPIFYEDSAKELPSFDQAKTTQNTSTISPANSDILNSNPTELNTESIKSFDAIPFGYDSSLFSNDFNFDNKFSDQVSSFCDKVNNPNYAAEDDTLPSLTNDGYNLESLNNNFALPKNTTEFGKKGFEYSNSDTTDNFSLNFSAFQQDDTSKSIMDDFIKPQKGTTDMKPKVKNLSSETNFIESSLAFPESTTVVDNINGNLYFRDNNQDNLADVFGLLNDEDEDDKDNGYESLIKKKLVTEECAEEKMNKHKVCELYKDATVQAEDGSYLKCSQVWSRLTKHPKYSELDIDGLCSELMLQAKCSDSGVVVESKELQKALSKYLSK